MPWYLSMAMQVIVRIPVTMAVVCTKGTVLQTTTPAGDKQGGRINDSWGLTSHRCFRQRFGRALFVQRGGYLSSDDLILKHRDERTKRENSQQKNLVISPSAITFQNKDKVKKTKNCTGYPLTPEFPVTAQGAHVVTAFGRRSRRERARGHWEF